ncbi:MGH1-like glycoside hydrolase domain-containing protein [Streptomyces sp. NPDC101181]|uniref:MGH1-like glycoside hydrolase domain-containing protein n=1 Tax=Streptomyces sp. NPDC101181 TaxID=3366125 RepID=UPI0038049ED2
MTDQLRAAARTLLENHWDGERGYCVPNPATYPHLWLWDSCFHAIAWARLGDARAETELRAVLEGQLPGGMVPHMRYGPAGPDTFLGPLPGTSSLTQPPMFGHAARALADLGRTPGSDVLKRARAGLDWLWDKRRSDDGLVFIVHPWEAGNDHAPRFDDWGAPGRTPADYDRAARTAWNKQQMENVTFDADGAAIASGTFVSCTAAFNAYTAFNMAELAAVTGDAELRARSGQLAEAMDAHLWNPEQRLWDDLPLTGGGPSVSAPLSDGLMGALITPDRDRALAALGQLTDPTRFAAPFGPANVARAHPAYDPDMYWRGAAWPQVNYLLWIALRRWGLDGEATSLAERTATAVQGNNWAEYWNPETGDGLGAAPQTWSALAACMS